MPSHPPRPLARVSSTRGRIARSIRVVLVASTPFVLADRSFSSSKQSDESANEKQRYQTVMTHYRAGMQERLGESRKLREILDGNAPPEEKRKAMEEYRAKREAWQTEMLSVVPKLTAQEKAVLQQRIKDRISRLPKERREAMELRLAMSEEMEKYRTAEKNASGEAHRVRMQQLMERHREAMQFQLAAAKKAEGQESINRPQSPFQQFMEAERQKLDAALASKDPVQRRAAIESFRAGMDQMREARL